jgi:histone-lysine N-methyltransferase SETMAR
METRKRARSEKSQRVLLPLTSRDKRGAILVQFRLGNSAAQCFETLQKALADQAPSKSTVYEWFASFRSGSFSLDDDPREGGPNFIVTPENIASMKRHLDEDRRITTRELEKLVGVSHGSVIKILHEHLGMRKLCARWVPHQLKPDHMKARVDFCEFMLQKFASGASEAVGNILTGDETWIYFYDPETKNQSKQWVAEHEEIPVKFCRERSVGKVMVAIFFRRCGILPPVLLEKGATVTGEWYSTVCLPKVLGSLEKQRPKAKDRNIFLHHDNAPGHKAKVTQSFLTSKKLAQLPHPPYSPDLAPCDFFLFPKMKKNLKGRRFDMQGDLVKAMEEELEKFSEADLQDCFSAWFGRMKKCIDHGGKYFEKY